ncbi:MAG: hypothetical protein EXR29_16285 [Betaproteobacteria bacterium]|nr:hypothetical protein [Betaproteobacteria bacterium]
MIYNGANDHTFAVVTVHIDRRVAGRGRRDGPCIAQPAAALADYPVKTIRIIVASSPGTASDIFARSLGEDLGEFYGQRIIVENRPGAGGLIGNTRVSKANADGYTLGMIDVTRVITELLRDPPPYRALADIIGVTHVASITNVLITVPSILARSPTDFVAYAREPGRAQLCLPRHRVGVASGR